MIRTFGIGLRAKKRRFCAFGIGPPAEIVDKSQGKYENNALGKDRFGTILGSVVDHIVPRKELFMFMSTMFPVFLRILSPHNTTQHTHPYHTHF